MTSSKNTFLSTAYLQECFPILRVISILIVSSVLFSCSSHSTRAPISSRSQPPSTKVVDHTVAPGETLYSIAWRYGLDYKGLAKVNRIDSFYRIFPGQIIRLDDNPGVIQQPVPVVAVAPPAPKPRPVNRHSVNPPAEKKATLVAPRATVPKKPIAPITRPEKKPTPVITATAPSLNKGKIYWRWPAKGKVITNFHRNRGLKKGIDIAGKKGESVNAAASGQVVYAGGGLRGYGKLVIIKHNETYLSAYAHNHRLRVKEGDIVKSGQRIADIGSTGVGINGKSKLHFQIRRDGKPVDPLPLLPKRKT